MAGWIEATISERREWTSGLITLQLSPRLERFVSGQFVNLGLHVAGEWVRRSYSLASAPDALPEFYLTRVQSGALTPALFELSVGAHVMMEPKASGFFTLDYVPPAKEAWLIATGTGLGPFISMLRSGQLWPRFERVVLVHGVREVDQLGYREELAELARTRGGQFRIVNVISRQPVSDEYLRGRIPALITSGQLQERAGLIFDAGQSHVLLCGNPEMIRDTTEALKAFGLRKHRQRAPGHITTEKYW